MCGVIMTLMTSCYYNPQHSQYSLSMQYSLTTFPLVRACTRFSSIGCAQDPGCRQQLRVDEPCPSPQRDFQGGAGAGQSQLGEQGLLPGGRVQLPAHAGKGAPAIKQRHVKTATDGNVHGVSKQIRHNGWRYLSLMSSWGLLSITNP